jgi:hypothetical protein
MKRGLLAAGVAAAMLMMPTAGQAVGGVQGPAWPAPGGTDWVGTGEFGKAGGVNWSYSNFDPSMWLELWWGPAGAGALNFAFDGEIDAEGETLTFSAADSDLENGIAVWTGEAFIPLVSGGATMPTRFMLLSAEALVFEGDLGIDGPGAVVPVTGDYSIDLHLEAFHGGTWKPALDLYDSLSTPAGAPGTVYSIGGGFYYIENAAPTANITSSPEVPRAEREATLTANSDDVDGTVVSVEWDLDDDGDFSDAAGETITHTFATAGDKVVSVRVTDDRGRSDTFSTVLKVVRCDSGDVSSIVHEAEAVAAEVKLDGEVHQANCSILGDNGL